MFLSCLQQCSFVINKCQSMFCIDVQVSFEVSFKKTIPWFINPFSPSFTFLKEGGSSSKKSSPLIASFRITKKKGVSNSIGNKYFLFTKERLKLPQQYIATKNIYSYSFMGIRRGIIIIIILHCTTKNAPNKIQIKQRRGKHGFFFL